MSASKWSTAEKKIARLAFETALEKALAGVVSDFKVRATAVTTPQEMWAIGDDLQRQRREIDRMFDYRYSMLTGVFAQLIHRGFMDESAVAGIADAKLADIHRELMFIRRIGH